MIPLSYRCSGRRLNMFSCAEELNFWAVASSFCVLSLILLRQFSWVNFAGTELRSNRRCVLKCSNCRKVLVTLSLTLVLFNINFVHLEPILQSSHSDWENGKAFSSQGKVKEFLTDWKSQGKSHKKLENSGNLR